VITSNWASTAFQKKLKVASRIAMLHTWSTQNTGRNASAAARLPRRMMRSRAPVRSASQPHRLGAPILVICGTAISTPMANGLKPRSFRYSDQYGTRVPSRPK